MSRTDSETDHKHNRTIKGEQSFKYYENDIYYDYIEKGKQERF